jgi:hypothetical protein
MHIVRNASIVLASVSPSVAQWHEIAGPGAVHRRRRFRPLLVHSAPEHAWPSKGKITNSTVIVNGAANTAAGFMSTATQSVGRATQNGKITNSVILGQGLNNTAVGFNSTATQEVGFAKDNGTVQNSMVQANGASNVAAGFSATARQKIGGAEGNGGNDSYRDRSATAVGHVLPTKASAFAGLEQSRSPHPTVRAPAQAGLFMFIA